MAQMKAGQAVIEALRAEGIEYTFGVVGTTTNSIVTEMYGRSDIHFVDTRHEEGAAFMAYGYARASGKPTACITTSGPGTINLATGIALAYKGRAPVIVIAGDVARDYIYRDGSQAFDLVGLFKPVTYMAPKEGAIAWLDGLALVKGAKNVEQVYALLDYIYTPEVAAQIAEGSGYNAVIKDADQHLSDKAKQASAEAYPNGAVENLWWRPPEPSWYAALRRGFADQFKSAAG